MLPFGQALLLTGGLRSDTSVHLLDLVQSDPEPVEFLALPTRGAGPGLRDAASWAIFENRLWCFGGISFGYDQFFNDVQCLDLETLDWRRVETTGEAPPPVAMHSATLVGPLWVVVGGWRGGDAYSPSVHVLDLRTLRWERPRLGGPARLPPLARHSAVRFGRNLVLYGGWSCPAPGAGGRPQGALFAIDTEAWTVRELRAAGPAPRPRDGHTACVAGDKMIVFAGWDGREALSDLHVLDLRTLTWSGRVELRGLSPSPRYMHAAALVTDPIPGDGEQQGGTMYVSGGFDGDARLSDLLALPLQPWISGLHFDGGAGAGGDPGAPYPYPAGPPEPALPPSASPPRAGPAYAYPARPLEAAPGLPPGCEAPYLSWPRAASPARPASPPSPTSAAGPSQRARPPPRPAPPPLRLPAPLPRPRARRSASPARAPAPARPGASPLRASWSSFGPFPTAPETDPRRAAAKQRKEEGDMIEADRVRSHYEEELQRIFEARQRRAEFLDGQKRPYYERAEESALEARYRTSSLVPSAWPPAPAAASSSPVGHPHGAYGW
eukprot:tig00021374_g21094.t1